MKILVATDLSETSVGAGSVAASLARRLGDTLVLAHVLPGTAQPDLAPEAAVFDAEMLAPAAAELERVAGDLRRENVVVEECILQGSAPAEALAERAREEQARVVALGTHDRRGVARVLLGSVAERTIELSPCPVLVVRAGAGALETRGREGKPLALAVGVDLSGPSAAAVEWVGQLRLATPCDVTFIHAYWPPAEHHRLGLPAPRELCLVDAEVVRVLEAELWERLATLAGSGSIALRIVPSWGWPDHVIASEACALGADLLVVGSHQHGRFRRFRLGSVDRGVLRSAAVPVVCVPERRPARSWRPPVSRITHVLAATDFSDVGNDAVAYAYALLDVRGGRAELCHVHDLHVSSAFPPAESGAGPLSPERRREIEARLHALVPRDAERRGVTTTTHVIEGSSAADAIVQTANRLTVDAVCLGTHGRTGLRRAVRGSVTDTVLEQCTRPVLVVPHR